ncbi:hypothetical protein HQQ80_18840 [Microbacteriaceae bacterium VKM Ac-2855]|nr:hypothetical protein [Microbacteriaceae bacterium VKM Ac-2855]
MSAHGDDDRPVVRALGRGCVAVAIAVSLASVIASVMGYELAALALIVTLVVFTTGIGLLALAGPTRRASPTLPRWTPLTFGLIAAASGIAVPVLYAAGMAYGASWLEWDPELGSYIDNERPGGFLVIIAALTLSIVATAAAITSAVAAVLGLARHNRVRTASNG